jgi:hypothetical protein
MVKYGHYAAHTEIMININEILVGRHEEELGRRPWRFQKKVLKLISDKQNVKMWAAFHWLGIGSSVRLLQTS